MSDIVIYDDGNIELNLAFDGETVWLNQSELVQLFDKDQSVISRHINNIFRDNEVDKKSNMQKMHIANSDKPVPKQKEIIIKLVINMLYEGDLL